MINVNGIKRNAKNIVKKYSDAQVKVREATSNDPWGPTSTIMAEIADLTYNVVAFSEIMQMIWKRLNDHGKNWRHVYKALVVLEYLIKTGTEKVAQQCTENIFAIQTLKDFQYMEENKDLGMNIREKSKKLVTLLKDSEKLKAERARAIKAKSRLAESMSSVGKSSLGSMMSSSGSSGSGDTTNNNNNNNSNNNGAYQTNFHNESGGSSSTSNVMHPVPDVSALAILSSDLDSARPQTASEEENQLKLALAISKEEAEQQEKTRKNDELRLKLALDVSKMENTAKVANHTIATLDANRGSLLDDLSGPSTSSTSAFVAQQPALAPAVSKTTIDDLLGLTIPPPEPQNDPWSTDPWQSKSNPPAISPPTNPLAAIDPTLGPMAAPTVPVSQIISSNSIFNKKPMSKNPFED